MEEEPAGDNQILPDEPPPPPPAAEEGGDEDTALQCERTDVSNLTARADDNDGASKEGDTRIDEKVGGVSDSVLKEEKVRSDHELKEEKEAQKIAVSEDGASTAESSMAGNHVTKEDDKIGDILKEEKEAEKMGEETDLKKETVALGEESSLIDKESMIGNEILKEEEGNVTKMGEDCVKSEETDLVRKFSIEEEKEDIKISDTPKDESISVEEGMQVHESKSLSGNDDMEVEEEDGGNVENDPEEEGLQTEEGIEMHEVTSVAENETIKEEEEGGGSKSAENALAKEGMQTEEGIQMPEPTSLAENETIKEEEVDGSKNAENALEKEGMQTEEGIQMHKPTFGAENETIKGGEEDGSKNTKNVLEKEGMQTEDGREGTIVPKKDTGKKEVEEEDAGENSQNAPAEEGMQIEEGLQGEVVGDNTKNAPAEKGMQIEEGIQGGEGEDVGENTQIAPVEEGMQIEEGIQGGGGEGEDVGENTESALVEEGIQGGEEENVGENNENAPEDDGDEAMEEEEEIEGEGERLPMEDEEEEEDDEPPPLPARKGGGKKKRGRPPGSARTAGSRQLTARRKDDEEVCFICFDGGELVVCDRRGCPKVYHPSCVNRDEAFFRARGRWNCGWHICSNCEKPARSMCYTCTYSLCKGCIKRAEFLCLRGNMGLCPACLDTVMLIEGYNNGDPTSVEGVNFEDKNSWEYLFRDYWMDLKRKLSLTIEEISAAKAKSPGVPLSNTSREKDSSDERASTDSSSARQLAAGEEHTSPSSKRKPRKRQRQLKPSPSSSSQKKAKKQSKDKNTLAECSVKQNSNWASRELLDLVAHMRDGDTSYMSQFDVQALLLEYIKQNNLRDPRRKSQIVCDRLLENLFSKPRVGHFEMLKLLESHFLEASPPEMDENHGGGVVDPDPDPVENSEGSNLMSHGSDSFKRRKGKGGKGGKGGVQVNLDDFASIDVHNVGLVYLRRNLMEELLEDLENFEEKVVGSFVRIRICGSGQQRQDVYRLVQVVGIGKAAEKYKTGKRMTDITLEILNLDKHELITIDIISNQDFTEEECKRLRQSIKCGFIARLTVGDVQEKARALQAVKVNDWIESEKLRLGHLRDRASETGRRKELRECVEKLQLLNTPEERMRRLSELPEIHADPTMDPDYESSDEGEPEVERKEIYSRPRETFMRSSSFSIDTRNKGGPQRFASEATSPTAAAISTSLGSKPAYSRNNNNDPYNNYPTSPTTPTPKPETSIQSTSPTVSTPNVNESEKIWHYSDPSGKVQGPFSMAQLRKWSGTGYFPPTLRVWQSGGRQEESILLTDALAGKFEISKDATHRSSSSGGSNNNNNGRVGATVSHSYSGYSNQQEMANTGELTRNVSLTNSGERAGASMDASDGVGVGESRVESVAPAFATSASSALERNSSFSNEGLNKVPRDPGLTSYTATMEHTALSQSQSSTHQTDPTVPAGPDPTNTPNPIAPTQAQQMSTPASAGPAAQLADPNTAWAAAMIAQQMAAANGGMNWNATPASANSNPWGVVGTTANMNMNMGWGGVNPAMAMANVNMGAGNMNPAMAWAQLQGMNPAAWGVGPFPGWVGPTPANWAGPTQGGNIMPVTPGIGGQVQGSMSGNMETGNSNNNNSSGNGGSSSNNNNNNNSNRSGSGWGPRGGICRFLLMNGYCKKGSQCNYYHPPNERR